MDHEVSRKLDGFGFNLQNRERWSKVKIVKSENYLPYQFDFNFRLAIFESQRENDCVAKYLIKEFEDATAKQYAIGNIIFHNILLNISDQKSLVTTLIRLNL